VNVVVRIVVGILTALALTIGAAAAATVEQLLAPCAACHGAQGQSQFPNIPSLGGQPSLYILFQLFFFREGQRKNPDMNTTAKTLSNDDLRQISDAISGLPAPIPGEPPTDRARFEHGQKLAAERRCGSCHGETFAGQDQTPRIAGQRQDYLVTEIRAFKSGVRIGYQAAMSEGTAGLNEGDISDLAYFLANVR
jgi:cytochrome c553